MKRFVLLLLTALLCFSLVACDLQDLLGTAPEIVASLSVNADPESTLELCLNTHAASDGISVQLTPSDGKIYYYNSEGATPFEITDEDALRTEEKDGVTYYFYSKDGVEYAVQPYKADSDKITVVEGDNAENYYHYSTSTDNAFAITVSGDVSSLLSGTTDASNAASSYGTSFTLDTHESGFGSMALLPASFEATADGKINADAILSVPFYGQDGRVSEMIPVAGNGTYADDAFRANGAHGLRAVGTTEDGVITEVYAFILDLSLRSGTDGATISLCTGGKSTFSLPLDETVEKEQLCELLGALRLVFFDTDTLTILNTASVSAQETFLTENSVVAQLVSDGAPLALTQAVSGKHCNISVLVYMDGMQIANSAIASASHLTSAISVNLTFTDK